MRQTVVRSSLMNFGASGYCYPCLPVSCKLVFLVCGSLRSKLLTSHIWSGVLSTFKFYGQWSTISTINRHSMGPNYNITTIRPSKAFHGRYTSVTRRSICQQSSFLLSNPNFEDSCGKEYRNSSTAKCLRDLTTSQSLLNCYWMHGTRLSDDGRRVIVSRLGVRLDTSASDSRI